jgi:glycosyltransferase involved in cell wall biosynthesis
MRYANALVSVGLPVRNGATGIEVVVKSVLGQDHENLEVVICDNASTDDTEEVCRDLVAQDSRIVYHRHPNNVGLLNNFISTVRLATGMFFRWLGDDDWLAPCYLSRGLDAFATDDRLILVTNQLVYTAPDGLTRTAAYNGTALGSDDPVTRFIEMLRLLNESYLLIDPLYGLFRREALMRIERRNMMHEDQVFATKLALAGPWGHVPEVLGWRNWKNEANSIVARKLDVPSWQAHFSTVLQCREMLRWLGTCDLNEHQRSMARVAITRFFVRRQRIVVTRRGRKIMRISREASRSLLTRSQWSGP